MSDAPPNANARAGWIGPLFRWELVRLARRGHAVRARAVLAGVVLLSLMIFTIVWFFHLGVAAVFLGTAREISLNESATFGDRFATTFLLSQLLVMIFLTPAYAAGGIAEEKERKTFDFLIASSLSSREIVLGKFFGRTVFLLSVLLAGMPILALTSLYGGVDIGLILASYLLTAGTVAVISASSLYAALSADSYRSAMFRAYGLTILYTLVGFGCFYISPIFIFVILQNIREESVPFLVLSLGYPLVEIVIVGILLALAVRRIRTIVTKQNPVPRREKRDATVKPELIRNVPQIAETKAYAVPLFVDEIPSKEPSEFNAVVTESNLAVSVDLPQSIVPQSTVPQPSQPAPPIPKRAIARVVSRRESERNGEDRFEKLKEQANSKKHPPLTEDDPFYWKEKYCSLHGMTADEDSLTGLKISAGILVGFALIGFGMIGFASAAAGKGVDVLFVTSLVGVIFHLMMIGSDACGRIALERSRSTLETLLSLPSERTEMLFAKWRVSLMRGFWWGIPCALINPLCILGSTLTYVGIPFVLYQIVLIPLATSIGLLLSMRCHSTAKAMIYYMISVGTFAIVPAVFYFGFNEASLHLQFSAWGFLAFEVITLIIVTSLLRRQFEHDGGGFDGAR
ncbi:MAG: ABC transporter permease subunit [Gemmataceae bacterium]